MNPKTTLSIYGSHDASFTFIDRVGNLKVLEYERFIKKRYAFFSDRFAKRENSGSLADRNRMLTHIKENTGDITDIVYLELSETDKLFIKGFFSKAEFHKFNHHTAHAASGFYTSKFDKALIISIDGGGIENDEILKTKLFIGQNGRISDLRKIDLDLGNPYSAIAYPISEIGDMKKEKHDLSSAGKVMGLCAYGTNISEWEDAMKEFYKSGGNLRELSKKVGLDLNKNVLISADGYNLSKTSQTVFEKLFFEYFWDTIEKFKLDVIVVGGCALNVLLNQTLVEKLNSLGLKLYVPPNPNDCGLSFGAFLNHTKYIPESITYSGFEILDIDKLPYYVNKYSAKKVSVKDIATLVSEGKIIGVLNGNSEVGPRALGNRSIICDPTYKDMKDILNHKVKFREWFRPFAPVCRLEDKDRFFINAVESEFMSFAPTVRDEYVNVIPSVVHVDKTARLQTVTKDQHEFFYDLLTEMENFGSLPLILNTSFNIKGKPILTTIEDAIYNLENTQMDHVVIEGYLFSK